MDTTKFYEWLYDEGKDVKTIMAYRTIINHFLQWIEDTSGDISIHSIKPIDIKEYNSFLKHSMNRKQATINKSISALKTFFNYLLSTNVIIDNPTTRIKLQKIHQNQTLGEKSISKWLSTQEQDKFIRYVETETREFQRTRNLAIINCILYTGLRVSEVAAIKLCDLKINTNQNVEITIRDGKRGLYNTVILVKKHSKYLINWLKLRKELKNSVQNKSEYAFVSQKSERLSERGIQLMMKKYSDLAKMDLVTPHRLRHTFCKNLALAGASIEVISKLARHENINTTAIYIDSSYEEQIMALAKL